MKHLKMYESPAGWYDENPEFLDIINYKVDDYVLIKREFLKSFEDSRSAKIIYNDYSNVPYAVQFSKGLTLWCRHDQIERKLHEDEIEEYELELNATKYNL